MTEREAIEAVEKIVVGKTTRTIKTLINALSSDTNNCILWPHAKTSKGYGLIRLEGAQGPRRMVHRVACEIAHGKVPTEHHYACHAPVICHNRSCVNPRHLRWATPSENTYDKRLDGTDNRGEANPQSKLTKEDVVKIRASKETGINLASQYGVSQSYISAIKCGKKWKHIPTPYHRRET